MPNLRQEALTKILGKLKALSNTPQKEALLEQATPALEKLFDPKTFNNYLKEEGPKGVWLHGSFNYKNSPKDLDLAIKYPYLWGESQGIKALEGTSGLDPYHFSKAQIPADVNMIREGVKGGKERYGKDYKWIKLLGLSSALGLPLIPGESEAGTKQEALERIFKSLFGKSAFTSLYRVGTKSRFNPKLQELGEKVSEGGMSVEGEPSGIYWATDKDSLGPLLSGYPPAAEPLERINPTQIGVMLPHSKYAYFTEDQWKKLRYTPSKEITDWAKKKWDLINIPDMVYGTNPGPFGYARQVVQLNPDKVIAQHKIGSKNYYRILGLAGALGLASPGESEAISPSRALAVLKKKIPGLAQNPDQVARLKYYLDRSEKALKPVHTFTNTPRNYGDKLSWDEIRDIYMEPRAGGLSRGRFQWGQFEQGYSERPGVDGFDRLLGQTTGDSLTFSNHPEVAAHEIGHAIWANQLTKQERYKVKQKAKALGIDTKPSELFPIAIEKVLFPEYSTGARDIDVSIIKPLLKKYWPKLLGGSLGLGFAVDESLRPKKAEASPLKAILKDATKIVGEQSSTASGLIGKVFPKFSQSPVQKVLKGRGNSRYLIMEDGSGIEIEKSDLNHLMRSLGNVETQQVQNLSPEQALDKAMRSLKFHEDRANPFANKPYVEDYTKRHLKASSDLIDLAEDMVLVNKHGVKMSLPRKHAELLEKNGILKILKGELK